MNSVPFDKLRVSTRSINKVFTLSEPYISYIGRVEVDILENNLNQIEAYIWRWYNQINYLKLKDVY